jgi:hypothetical protein
MWVIIVSREPLGDGSRLLHFIILLSCAIAQRMRGVYTCDSLLGSDVAPTSTRHKEDIKSSTIFNYFHCRHGYVSEIWDCCEQHIQRQSHLCVHVQVRYGIAVNNTYRGGDINRILVIPWFYYFMTTLLILSHL